MSWGQAEVLGDKIGRRQVGSRLWYEGAGFEVLVVNLGCRGSIGRDCRCWVGCRSIEDLAGRVRVAVSHRVECWSVGGVRG